MDSFNIYRNGIFIGNTQKNDFRVFELDRDTTMKYVAKRVDGTGAEYGEGAIEFRNLVPTLGYHVCTEVHPNLSADFGEFGGIDANFSLWCRYNTPVEFFLNGENVGTVNGKGSGYYWYELNIPYKKFGNQKLEVYCVNMMGDRVKIHDKMYNYTDKVKMSKPKVKVVELKANNEDGIDFGFYYENDRVHTNMKTTITDGSQDTLHMSPAYYVNCPYYGDEKTIKIYEFLFQAKENTEYEMSVQRISPEFDNFDRNSDTLNVTINTGELSKNIDIVRQKRTERGQLRVSWDDPYEDGNTIYDVYVDNGGGSNANWYHLDFIKFKDFISRNQYARNVRFQIRTLRITNEEIDGYEVDFYRYSKFRTFNVGSAALTTDAWVTVSEWE